MKPKTYQWPKGYLWFDNFFKPELISAVSTRKLGNMSLVYGRTRRSLNNRKDFLNQLNIAYNSLICAEQIHASNIEYVRDSQRGRGALSYKTSIPKTDALITDERNLPLAVFTADCLSIFVFDPKRKVIGIIHAGWRSTRENIVEKTLKLMQEKFGINTTDLCLVFGPCIRECCYEVGKEFKEFFPYDTIQRSDRFYFDLISLNRREFLDQGIRQENIVDCGICTVCNNKDFFSYRREGRNSGRMMSVIMLK